MYSEKKADLEYIVVQVCLTLMDDEILEISQIPARIYEETGVRSRHLKSEVRTEALSKLRNAASFVYKARFGLSFPEIGTLLKRDHSTIIHGYRKMGLLLGYTDEELRQSKKKSRKKTASDAHSKNVMPPERAIGRELVPIDEVVEQLSESETTRTPDVQYGGNSGFFPSSIPGDYNFLRDI